MKFQTKKNVEAVSYNYFSFFKGIEKKNSLDLKRTASLKV